MKAKVLSYSPLAFLATREGTFGALDLQLAPLTRRSRRFNPVKPEPPRLIGHRIAAEEYLRIHTVIGSYCSVAITGGGTGVTHNAMKGILQSADSLLIGQGRGLFLTWWPWRT